jgi:hypothetical protein
MIMSSYILLRMRNDWDNICTENKNKYFMLTTFFPSKIATFMRCGKIR